MRRASQLTTQLLGVLAVLFLVRVLLQFVQFVGEIGWLPSFDRWQSGAVPYEALLGAQVLILMVMVWALTGTAAGVPRLGDRFGRPVELFGYAYGAFMVFRFVAGFTFARGHSWLDNPLPSFFHIVLAAFVVVWSKWELSAS